MFNCCLVSFYKPMITAIFITAPKYGLLYLVSRYYSHEGDGIANFIWLHIYEINTRGCGVHMHKSERDHKFCIF